MLITTYGHVPSLFLTLTTSYAYMEKGSKKKDWRGMNNMEEQETTHRENRKEDYKIRLSQGVKIQREI